jgi:HNH endonuclease
VATFPIDHIDPRIAGGTTEMENLALTCPQCNASKWTAVESTDPDSGVTVPLFHPRQQSWDEHFEWPVTQTGELIGKTPIGRATIQALRINDSDMIELRLLLMELRLFAEARG